MAQDRPPNGRWKHPTKLYKTEYESWRGMFTRCYDPTYRKFKDYGGRGIVVCDRWKSFDAFVEDMGKKPSPELSIDRIDNDGNYEPSNCRWATEKEQKTNRRNTHWIEFNGETLCRTEWARRIGIDTYALKYRLDNGWSVEEALTTPRTGSSGDKEVTFNGKTQTVRDWERELGMRKGTLHARLFKYNMSVEDAMTRKVNRLAE